MTGRLNRLLFVKAVWVAVAMMLCLPAGLTAQTFQVNPAIAAALQEAISAANSSNRQRAITALNAADTVASKTKDDADAIAKTREYVGVKLGDASLGGVPAAKARLAMDYNAGRFKDVIADADLLQQLGALDDETKLLVGQAYFKVEDKNACHAYMQKHFPNPAGDALGLAIRCAYDAGDLATFKKLRLRIRPEGIGDDEMVLIEALYQLAVQPNMDSEVARKLLGIAKDVDLAKQHRVTLGTVELESSNFAQPRVLGYWLSGGCFPRDYIKSLFVNSTTGILTRPNSPESLVYDTLYVPWGKLHLGYVYNDAANRRPECLKSVVLEIAG
jgi:hypothetical protein